MLRSPLHYIASADAWLQKRFDSVVHAVMRKTGASKRAVRRNGWGFCLAMSVGTSSLHRVGLIWVDYLLWMLYVGLLLWDDWQDGRAEATGWTSTSAADALSSSRKTYGYGVLLPAIIFLPYRYRAHGFVYAVCEVGFALAWIFQGYLCKTSPHTPKKQTEKTPSPFAQLSEV